MSSFLNSLCFLPAVVALLSDNFLNFFEKWMSNILNVFFPLIVSFYLNKLLKLKSVTKTNFKNAFTSFIIHSFICNLNLCKQWTWVIITYLSEFLNWMIYLISLQAGGMFDNSFWLSLTQFWTLFEKMYNGLNWTELLPWFSSINIMFNKYSQNKN